MPLVAKPQSQPKAAKPARKAARQTKAQRAGAQPATKADIEELKAALLAEIRHAFWAASLQTEPCDDETAKLVREGLAERGQALTLDQARRELGL